MSPISGNFIDNKNIATSSFIDIKCESCSSNCYFLSNEIKLVQTENFDNNSKEFQKSAKRLAYSTNFSILNNEISPEMKKKCHQIVSRLIAISDDIQMEYILREKRFQRQQFFIQILIALNPFHFFISFSHFIFSSFFSINFSKFL